MRVASTFWLLWIMLPVNIGGDDFFFNDCLFAIFSVKGIGVGAWLASNISLG